MTVSQGAHLRIDVRTPRWLWFACVGFAFIYAFPSIWLLQNYLQHAFDLGIYDQALWLIAHGESFVTVAGVYVNSVHFSPVLFLLSPIAFVPGGAIPELVLQSTLIATGVFPAWMLGRFLGRDPRWFVLVYAIHPGIVGGSWFGWRPWNIAVPVFMWLAYWLVSHPSLARLTTAGVIMLLFREDLALWIGLVAIVLYLAGRLPWATLWRAGAALAMATAVVILIVLPRLSPVGGYFFADPSQLLSSPVEVKIASLIPRGLFLIVPLGIIPTRLNWKLMAPLGIPVVGLLARGGNALTSFYHYDMMFVPVLLVIAGLSTQPRYRPWLLASLSILVLFTIGPLRPFQPMGGPDPFQYSGDAVTAFDRVRSVIDTQPDAETMSMSLPGFLVPHYSERTRVFSYPAPVDDLYAAADTQYRVFRCPEPDIVVAFHWRLTPAWVETLSENYTETPIVADRLSVWERKEPAVDGECSVRFVDE